MPVFLGFRSAAAESLSRDPWFSSQLASLEVGDRLGDPAGVYVIPSACMSFRWRSDRLEVGDRRRSDRVGQSDRLGDRLEGRGSRASVGISLVIL